MKKSKNTLRKTMAAGLLLMGILCFMGGCGIGKGEKGGSELELYSEDTFHYDVVYADQATKDEIMSVISLAEKLEKEFGVAPNVISEKEAEKSNDRKKIFVGSVEASKSVLPKLEEMDSYWCVMPQGDDIMICASAEGALSVAVNYFVTDCIGTDSTGVLSAGWAKEVRQSGYYRDGWDLYEIPSYWGDNKLSEDVYDCGSSMTGWQREDGLCMMQTVYDTDDDEAKAYAELLKQNGFKQDSNSTIEENEFYRFTNSDWKVSLNYFGNTKEAQIILDKSSIATTELSYTYEPKEGERAEIYLYGMKYSKFNEHDDLGPWTLSGLSMVVKCADNSVIVIDGGDPSRQMYDEDKEELLRFLREITGTPESEKVRISAWYLTHYHNDHIGLSGFLETHSDYVIVERLLSNVPGEETELSTVSSMCSKVSGAMVRNNGDYMETKLHTGDSIQIADINIQVVYTHEDLARSNGKWSGTDFNDTTTVCKLTTSEGMSLTVFGDMETDTAANALLGHFSAETLHTTFMQQPHHGYSLIGESMYQTVNPQVMLTGSREYNSAWALRVGSQTKWAQQYSQEWYWSGEATVGFAYENGRAEKVYERAVEY